MKLKGLILLVTALGLGWWHWNGTSNRSSVSKHDPKGLTPVIESPAGKDDPALLTIDRGSMKAPFDPDKNKLPRKVVSFSPEQMENFSGHQRDALKRVIRQNTGRRDKKQRRVAERAQKHLNELEVAYPSAPNSKPE